MRARSRLPPHIGGVRPQQVDEGEAPSFAPSRRALQLRAGPRRPRGWPNAFCIPKAECTRSLHSDSHTKQVLNLSAVAAAGPRRCQVSCW